MCIISKFTSAYFIFLMMLFMNILVLNCLFQVACGEGQIFPAKSPRSYGLCSKCKVLSRTVTKALLFQEILWRGLGKSCIIIET